MTDSLLWNKKVNVYSAMAKQIWSVQWKLTVTIAVKHDF